jgi:hypothetical protein
MEEPRERHLSGIMAKFGAVRFVRLHLQAYRPLVVILVN